MAEIEDKSDHRQFEKEVAELFRQRGWSVNHRPPGKDAGVDIDLKKGDVTAGVQVKNYPNSTVSRPKVQQYAGARMEHSLDEFYLVTSGSFTKPARDAGKNVDVELINGEEFEEMVEQTDQPSFEIIKQQILNLVLQAIKSAVRKVEPWTKDGNLKFAMLFSGFLMFGGLTTDTGISTFYVGLSAAVVLLTVRAITQ